MRRFRPGEAITWRSIAAREGVVGHAWPWTMVRDEADLIVLYMPAGASLKMRTGDFGGPRDRFLIRWDGGYRDNVWTGAAVTLLHRPEDAHSVWLARDAETIRPLWWYVNLEEHWRRTAIGFDSRDQWLDLWADAERREGTWKDEDELQWAVEHEIIDAEAAAEVRREGERALQRVQRWEAPLDQGWERWRPDPAWRVPVLPEGWDRPPLSGLAPRTRSPDRRPRPGRS
ncbi:MAG: hypothetical protein AUH85_03460 [Chloroflexi bacterium 13_1_40CM_4_68_4]|nr:MAG: hypothetical protein AUH85_03460 [Chloroflexi bacterium 13_1_40CM_4_68_4]